MRSVRVEIFFFFFLCFPVYFLSGFVRVLPLISNWHPCLIRKFFKLRSVRVEYFLCFPVYLLSGFLFRVNSKYFFESWCCILDYFILNCKLWDKFLNSMIILIFIISYILMFYRNFELIFEFMVLKRAPICGRNVCLAFFLTIFICNSENFIRRK